MNEDKRIKKTKANIKKHFLELLKVHPLEEITISSLTLACDINRSTFYRNYEDKFALLDEIIDELFDKYKQIAPDYLVIQNNINSQNIYPYIITPIITFFEENHEILSIIKCIRRYLKWIGC